MAWEGWLRPRRGFGVDGQGAYAAVFADLQLDGDATCGWTRPFGDELARQCGGADRLAGCLAAAFRLVGRVHEHPIRGVPPQLRAARQDRFVKFTDHGCSGCARLDAGTTVTWPEGWCGPADVLRRGRTDAPPCREAHDTLRMVTPIRQSGGVLRLGGLLQRATGGN